MNLPSLAKIAPFSPHRAPPFGPLISKVFKARYDHLLGGVQYAREVTKFSQIWLYNV